MTTDLDHIRKIDAVVIAHPHNLRFVAVEHFQFLLDVRRDDKQQFTDYQRGGIIRYYNALKIKEARKLIREGQHNLAQIADLLRFGSPQYFSKRFKAVMHMTPSEYCASIMK